MRAAVMRGNQIVVDDVPEPELGPRQVRAEVIACGICGSDLHARLHARQLVDVSARSGNDALVFDPDRDLVMGHEFSARVVELGPGEDRFKEGDEVAVMPGFRTPEGSIVAVGYDNDYPGAYSERIVTGAGGLRLIPNGLDATHAALTEPMAVGLHAVNKSQLAKPGGDSGSAVVLGCGPVGLAVIAALQARGIGPIVAADFSATRRTLAETMGADEVVDPREQPAVEAWRAAGGGRPLSVFEAVGAPGMIDQAMSAAPGGSEIVVVGVCMEQDQIWPVMGINKELSINFALGWTPEEFTDTLHSIAEGETDVKPLLTGEVGLDGVAHAFDVLADPEQHAKIIVRPELDGDQINPIGS